MKNDAEGEGRRWLEQARADLDDAAYLLAGSRFNVACFIAQQAAEKALKYPNGLPGGVPKNAFDRVEADRALAIATDITAAVAAFVK
jgi:hypothetical protein